MNPLDGRCVNCGYLAIRGESHQKGNPIEEVGLERRETGELFILTKTDRGPDTGVRPCCYRQVPVFVGDEYTELASMLYHDKLSKERLRSITLEIIRKDRQCPHWRQHAPGSTPKEHYAQEREDTVESDRRRWEEAQEENRRAYEAVLDADRQRSDRRQKRTDRILVIFGIVIATMTLGLVTSDSLFGWLFRSLFG